MLTFLISSKVWNESSLIISPRQFSMPYGVRRTRALFLCMDEAYGGMRIWLHNMISPYWKSYTKISTVLQVVGRRLVSFHLLFWAQRRTDRIDLNNRVD
jgi:hypothetical protein